MLIYLGRITELLSRVQAEGGAGLVLLRRTALAQCMALDGRRDEAAKLVAEALSERGYGPDCEGAGTGALVRLLYAAILIEDRGLVRMLAQRLTPLAFTGSSGGQFSTPTCVARHLGDAAASLGEREQALAYYEQGLDLATRMRHRPEIALIHLGMAELLLGAAGAIRAAPTETGSDSVGATHASPSGSELRPSPGSGETPALPEGTSPTPSSRSEAMRHLDIAIAEFRKMKMQPSLERALRHKEVLKA